MKQARKRIIIIYLKNQLMFDRVDKGREKIRRKTQTKNGWPLKKRKHEMTKD
jgi:hypothetical protein